MLYSNEFDTTGTGGWQFGGYPAVGSASVAPSWSNAAGYPFSGAGALTSTVVFDTPGDAGTSHLGISEVMYTGAAITSFVGTTINVEVYVTSPTTDIHLQLFAQSFTAPSTYGQSYGSTGTAYITVTAGTAAGWHAMTFVPSAVASGNWDPTKPNSFGIQVIGTAAQTLTVGIDHVSVTQ